MKKVIFGIMAISLIFLGTEWIFPYIIWKNSIAFVLLPFSIFLLIKWINPKKTTALKFSSIESLKNIAMSWRIKVYLFLPVVRVIAFVFLVFALARPQVGNANTKITSEGIAIMMVIDVSDSMRALDFSEKGKRKNRLEVVKEVFYKFVDGDGAGLMRGRRGDLIGLIAFGGFPESKCPLTLDHDALLNVLQKQVVIPERIYDQEGNVLNDEEFRTAIGDALLIGVERLKHYKGKSKVMILLTDGEDTASVVRPLDSTQIAKKEGIKIYTIGVGSNEEVPFPFKNMFGEEVLRGVRVPMDEELLKQIALTTDGAYYHAKNKRALEDIYKVIDTLERQEIHQDRYGEYHEIYWIFVLPGLLLILLDKILLNTIIRKIP